MRRTGAAPGLPGMLLLTLCAFGVSLLHADEAPAAEVPAAEVPADEAPGAKAPAATTGTVLNDSVAAAPDAVAANAGADTLVAVCVTCHRPDGAAIPVIHGRPAEQLARSLEAFANATDATVMHRIVRGLTAVEIDAVARRFSEALQP